ncbi:TPA: Veg family protein, partial [Streptococcus suis]
YQSLFIVEFEDPNNTFVESYTYSDILTEKILIHYLD